MTARVVAVVGGGIGGLSPALSLLRAGFDVHVYEQASALGEVGAGVQVSPNASRILHRLGLAAELARTGVKPLAWHQRRWDDGRTLLRAPLAEPLEATFGFPITRCTAPTCWRRWPARSRPSASTWAAAWSG
jgi:salicylate hydroxylase